MTTHANATFEVKSWDEQTSNEVDGRLKLTRASVVFAYKGDLEGQSAVEYLMLYRDDESAFVVGLERLTGQLAGKTGTFVLEHRGKYADGVASAACTIMPDSGTGDLKGLHGSGTSTALKDGTTKLTLDYDFA
jgi:hypothetical protein